MKREKLLASGAWLLMVSAIVAQSPWMVVRFHRLLAHMVRLVQRNQKRTSYHRKEGLGITSNGSG